MLNVFGAAASIGVMTLLIGCSAQQPASPAMAASPAAAAAPSTSASAGGGLDGVYRGPEGGTDGNSRCSRRLNTPIRVTGGVATMATAVTGILEGPVGPNGSLAIQSGRANLSGTFANGEFNGSYSNGSCAYTLKYAKR